MSCENCDDIMTTPPPQAGSEGCISLSLLRVVEGELSLSSFSPFMTACVCVAMTLGKNAIIFPNDGKHSILT